MRTGASLTARGAEPAATTRSGCIASVAVQAPEGQPICSACRHGAPPWGAADETTPPAAGGMAQEWDDGMAPKADDGTSHNTAIANRVAITRLQAVGADFDNQSPGASRPCEDCTVPYEERRKDA